MKTKIIILISFILIVISAHALLAQSKTVKANIKVYGNCGMCKQRIEKALDHNGIKMAKWDTKTKNLEVVYNSKKINEQKISELIAAVGHDTDLVKANNEVYAKLPFCCLYRDHDHSGIKDDDGKDHH
ncbi:MAG: heavy-metal-associated domain-containing protein [Bacteroidota bacterium]